MWGPASYWGPIKVRQYPNVRRTNVCPHFMFRFGICFGELCVASRNVTFYKIAILDRSSIKNLPFRSRCGPAWGPHSTGIRRNCRRQTHDPHDDFQTLKETGELDKALHRNCFEGASMQSMWNSCCRSLHVVRVKIRIRWGSVYTY